MCKHTTRPYTIALYQWHHVARTFAEKTSLQIWFRFNFISRPWIKTKLRHRRVAYHVTSRDRMADYQFVKMNAHRIVGIDFESYGRGRALPAFTTHWNCVICARCANNYLFTYKMWNIWTTEESMRESPAKMMYNFRDNGHFTMWLLVIFSKFPDERWLHSIARKQRICITRTKLVLFFKFGRWRTRNPVRKFKYLLVRDRIL